MASPEKSVTATAEPAHDFARLSARRLLVVAGIALIVAGMIFGDIFAIFVLHQNAARVGASLVSAANAALAGDVNSVRVSFASSGAFLENRGTKVDTHVHLIGFGYLALMLAIIQPWVCLSESAKKRAAWLFIYGAVLLPVGVFLIHYVGLSYSPLSAIGWASIFADLGGLTVLVATAVFLFSLRADQETASPVALLPSTTTAGRHLFVGGMLLVMAGVLHGALYAGVNLYRQEAADFNVLSHVSRSAAGQDHAGVNASLNDYGQLQGDKAVKIAAHAHAIEFGFLAMLLAFFQPYVQLADSWRKRWAGVMLAGSLLLPVCVLMELRFGLLAGGLADFGGLLVIVALLAMSMGILRYTGQLDAAAGGHR